MWDDDVVAAPRLIAERVLQREWEGEFAATFNPCEREEDAATLIDRMLAHGFECTLSVFSPSGKVERGAYFCEFHLRLEPGEDLSYYGIGTPTADGRRWAICSAALRASEYLVSQKKRKSRKERKNRKN